MICIITFYKFISLPDFKELREPLKNKMLSLNIKGTILLADEGLNSTISGELAAIKAFINYLSEDIRFNDLEFKWSYHSVQPFGKTKVKLKKTILSLPEKVSVQERVGTYISSSAWNDLITQEDIILLDTRNDYEIECGTFEGAINPQIDNFRDLPKFIEDNSNLFKDKKIAMFCTGGIRCEKFSSYLLQKGFPEIYHLKGGILQYLEDIPPQKSKWKGNCFVFDERTAVNHSLSPAKI